MIFVVLSIIAGGLAAWVLYYVLFYDREDFLEGLGKFTKWLIYSRRRTIVHRIIHRNEPTPANPADFEDEGWSSGIRFLLFLGLSIWAGFLTHNGLHKFWDWFSH